MSSGRLPGKVLMPIAGKPLLTHVIERVRACPLVGRVVVATTTLPSDDAVVSYCERHEILTYRGAVENVLSRFVEAAKFYNCRRIVRVCGDNPFLDTDLLTDQLRLTDDEDDYCSYQTSASEPLIIKPLGLCAEVVTRSALDAVSASELDSKHREHVTMFIYSHADKFRIRWLPLPWGIDPEFRFTVDYPEDIAICERIVAAGAHRNAESLMKFVRGNSDVEAMISSLARARPKTYN